MIQIVCKSEINKIEENGNRNMMEIYKYNNGNSANNSRHFKLISFFINNRLSYFEQFIKAVMMISSIFDIAEIGDH